MLLEDADIREFMEIYKEDFGEEISESEARMMASQLLRLYEALSRPLPSERERSLANPTSTDMLEV